MIDKRCEELISAYLDGELSAEEQQQVEELLATSAEARQLLDELRALSHTLQAMPRQRVREDLGAKILRAAERTMLTGAGPAVASPDERSRASESRVGLPAGRSWRVVGWTAAAMAASLLMIATARQVWIEQGASQPRSIAKAPAVASPGESVDVEKEAAAPVHAPMAEKRGDELGLSGGRDNDAGWAGGKLAEPAAPADRAVDESEMRDMLVVRVDVSPAAARAGAFQKVLARQQIAWEADDQYEEQRLGRELANLEQTKRFVDEVKTPGPAEAAEKQAPSDGEMVYVEATPEQIEGTLADLAAQPAQYRAVSVEPAPGIASQQPLASYNRDYGDNSLRKKADGNYAKDQSDDKPSHRRASKTEASQPRIADGLKAQSLRGEADQASSQPAKPSAAPESRFRQQASAPALQTESPPLGQLGNARARRVQLPAAGIVVDQEELNRSRESLVGKNLEEESQSRSAVLGGREATPDAMRVLFVFRVVESDHPAAAGDAAK